MASLFLFLLLARINTNILSALVTKKLHQKAIDALKLSEERFETIFKDAPAGIFYYDNDLKVVESNNEMLQILQIPREKMI